MEKKSYKSLVRVEWKRHKLGTIYEVERAFTVSLWAKLNEWNRTKRKHIKDGAEENERTLVE